MLTDKYIFDIEADGLIKDATKIWVLSYTKVDDWSVKSITNYDDIVEFFKRPATFIGHNIAGYDLIVLNKILGIDINFKYIDTLYLSQYIYPERNSYSLESFGEDFGVHKVKIDDWSSLSLEEYIGRCEQDVKINANLYMRIMKRISLLYDDDSETIDRFINYMSFKSSCCFKQILSPVYIDKKAAQDLLIDIATKRNEKIELLKKVMPKVPVYAIKNRPKVMYKKDGGLSSAGESWVELLRKNGLQLDYNGSIKVIIKYLEPKPTSSVQVKDWLFSLGWVPATYKFNRDKKTNAVKQVPQITKESKELCESVLLLAEKEPAINELEGLGILNHRMAQVEGFLQSDSNPNDLIEIAQELMAITSTFRFRHKNIVNLPSVEKPWGNEIRGLFVSPKDHLVVGCDVKNLESRTRDHYIYPLDPKYVEEMNSPGFDSHLDIAVLAGFITKEQEAQHKSGEANFSKARKLGKVVNFSAVYGTSAKTLSRSSGLTEYESKKLLDVYWKRNWAVKVFAQNRPIKDLFNKEGTSDKFKWVLNPVSKFWMELRSQKDVFSAVNQSTGVFVFDTFLMYAQTLGVEVNMQMHDEILFYCRIGEEDIIKQKLNKAIALTNAKLNLNVSIGIDFKFGTNYAEVH